MKTPVDTPKDIIKEALLCESYADGYDLEDVARRYVEAILRKLEERYVIVDPDNVTEGMVEASLFETFAELADECGKTERSIEAKAIAAALRAAPQWSKGSEE